METPPTIPTLGSKTYRKEIYVYSLSTLKVLILTSIDALILNSKSLKPNFGQLILLLA